MSSLQNCGKNINSAEKLLGTQRLSCVEPFVSQLHTQNLEYLTFHF
jgi:hypothetical protein